MPNVSCSFCFTPSKKTNRMFSAKDGNGIDVYICDGCVQRCNHAIVSGKKKKTVTDKKIDPISINAYLDKHVIGQALAKKVLSVSISSHYKRLEIQNDNIQKNNVMLIGSSGSGKTLLAKTIAEYLSVPFSIVDATTLTEPGYVGGDVEDILITLLREANNDFELAQKGIVFIDEIDKKIKKSFGNGNKDISGEGVQQALLKMVEGGKFSIPMTKVDGTDTVSTFDTSNLLFICGGAFVDLEKAVKENRKNKTSMGFSAVLNNNASRAELLKDVNPGDLIKYGLIPEFVGRFSSIVPLDDLDETTLRSILTDPKDCLVEQYKTMFDFEGVDIEFEDKYLNTVVKRALDQKTGARGLKTILEKDLLGVQFDISSLLKKGYTRIVIKDASDIKYYKRKKVSKK